MEKSAQKVWDNCLKIIRDNINHQSYETWFQPIRPLRLVDNVLTIQVPSQFFYEWLEEHYIDLLKKTIKKELGTSGRLEYSVLIDILFASPTKTALITVICLFSHYFIFSPTHHQSSHTLWPLMNSSKNLCLNHELPLPKACLYD